MRACSDKRCGSILPMWGCDWRCILYGGCVCEYRTGNSYILMAGTGSCVVRCEVQF